MGGPKQQNKEFYDYPQYKKNYIKAFDRMIEKRQQQGKKNTFKNGEEVMRWWLGENPNQIRIEDILDN